MVVTRKETKADQLINYWVSQNLSFAIYKLPEKEKINIIFSDKGFNEIDKVDFDVLPPGFAFAPYNKSGKPLYIESDHQWETDLNDPTIETLLDFEIKSNSEAPYFKLNPENSEENNQEEYFKELDEIIDRIVKGEARKVVLSRKKFAGKLEGNDFYLGFKNLCQAYPEAMVSFVHIAHLNQLWYGATPELLVSTNEQQVFKTVALASTQSAYDKDGKKINPIDALWTAKEIEEQALVGRYIINCLKKIRVREFEEEGPKTIQAGNLLHLRTNYNINNKLVKYPSLSSVVLELLHPTPAICGMPKNEAEHIISDIEKHDREFYCGFLGPVNQNDESQLFVNLRTMKIEDRSIYLFAGGGIMEDSRPEKEWHETEIKMKTVAKAFTNY